MLFLVFSGNIAISQTINPNHLDGTIYFKLKDNVVPYPQSNGIVNPRNTKELATLISKYGITSVKNTFFSTSDSKLHRVYRVTFSNIDMVDQLIRDLSQNSQVEYAENAPIFKPFYTPNDYGSTAGNNWHLTKINAKGAWDVTKGLASVKVAVIDNAIWTDHPDLVGKVDLKIDLADIDNNTNPPAGTTDAAWSHGTHTSGLIAANTDNSTGISSIGFNTRLLACKIGRDSDAAMVNGFEGITWAADNGADVISMSWGGPQYFITMQLTVNYAYNKGIVLLAAAGNDGTEVLSYPAACDHVISVGSTDGDDKVSSFSQYGTWLDVMSPGGFQTSGFLDQLLGNSVYSLAFGTGTAGYTKMQGTSMACPIAAGLCALMIAADTNITPDKVESILKSTCVNINSLNTAKVGKIGSGRINAAAAVTAVVNQASSLVSDFKANTIMVSQGGLINFQDQSIGNPITWKWNFPGGNPSTSTLQNPQGIKYTTSGFYDVTLTITTATDTAVEVKHGFITVRAPSSSGWIEQSSAFTEQFRGINVISIVDKNIVWAGAFNGAAQTTADFNTFDFTRTIDGGNTWTPGSITGVPATYVVSDIHAISDQIAWAAMYNNNTANPGGGGIYKTINGGVTWTKQPTAIFTDAAAFPNFVYFWDANNGYCMGDPTGGYYEMYTTTDGGDNWVRISQANTPTSVSGEFGFTGEFDVVGDTMWWPTNKGSILRSIDKGVTWTKYATGLPECNKIAFNDNLNGIVQQLTYDQTTNTLTTFAMKVTHDGGETWTTVTPTGTYWKGGIDAVPGKPGMLVCIGNSYQPNEHGSAFSFDYGQTWTVIDTTQYTNVKFLDINTGWAGGYNLDETTEGMYKWKGIMQVKSLNNAVCAGDPINVAVRLLTNFTSGNQYTAQLSDANGSFTNPINIGTLNSNVTDTIAAVIPANTSAGSQYRVRVLSSTPAYTSADNGIDIQINTAATANAGPDNQICAANNFSLNGIAVGADSVLWTTDNTTATFADAKSINTVYNTNNTVETTHEIVLTAYSTCGITKDTMILTLTNTATASAGQDVEICNGESTTLTANGGSSYQWNNQINNQQNIVNPTTTTTYIVTATGGCGLAVDSVVVFVNPLPQNTLATSDPLSFCMGGQAVLNAPTGNYTYKWFKGGNEIANQTGVSLITSTTGNYSVEIKSNKGCSILSNEIAINVNPLPSVTLTVSDTNVICDGETATITASNIAGASYVWYKNDTIIPNQTSNAFDATESGSYYVEVTNNNTCSALSSSEQITVKPTPAKPTITWNGTFLASSVILGNQWYRNNVIIQGATSKNYTPTQSGTYSVIVTTGGCPSPMSDDTLVSVGINDANFNSNNVSIFPNPTKNNVNITINNINNNSGNISIYNMLGSLLFSEQINSKLNEYKTTINCSSFNKGMYFVKIRINNETYSEKLIVE